MIGFNIDLPSLGVKKENTPVFFLIIIMIIMLISQIGINKDISHIKKDLSNHITETNKKIEAGDKALKEGQDKMDNKLDNLINTLLSNKMGNQKED